MVPALLTAQSVTCGSLTAGRSHQWGVLGAGVDAGGEESAGGGGAASVDDGEHLRDGAREGQAVGVGGHEVGAVLGGQVGNVQRPVGRGVRDAGVLAAAHCCAQIGQRLRSASALNFWDRTSVPGAITFQQSRQHEQQTSWERQVIHAVCAALGNHYEQLLIKKWLSHQGRTD